jgi:hypothetical protein
VIKRLDDVSDDVRKAAIMTLVKMFKPLPPDYCMEVSYGHLEVLFGTMLIHLDDPDPGFQRTALGKKLVHDCISLDLTGHPHSGVPRNLWGGVQQIQLRTEGRENGDLWAVAP